MAAYNHSGRASNLIKQLVVSGRILNGYKNGKYKSFSKEIKKCGWIRFFELMKYQYKQFNYTRPVQKVITMDPLEVKDMLFYPFFVVSLGATWLFCYLRIFERLRDFPKNGFGKSNLYLGKFACEQTWSLIKNVRMIFQNESSPVRPGKDCMCL